MAAVNVRAGAGILLRLIFLCLLVQSRYRPIFGSAAINPHRVSVRWCADEKCSVPVSTGRTTNAGSLYNSGYVHIKTFRPNVDVVIFAKTDGDLWEGEIGGKRGFFSKRFIKEENIVTPKNKLVSMPPHDFKKESVPSTSVVESPTSPSVDVNPSSAPHVSESKLPPVAAATAVWFPEEESIKPANADGEGFTINSYSSVQSKLPDVTEENVRELKDDRLHDTNNEGYIVVDNSIIPLDSMDLVPMSSQPSETVTSQLPSLFPKADYTMSSSAIEELATVTNDIQPTPTVSTDAPPSVSRDVENVASVGLLERLAEVIDEGLSVLLKGEKQVAKPHLPIISVNSDWKGEYEQNPSVNGAASILTPESLADSIAVSKSESETLFNGTQEDPEGNEPAITVASIEKVLAASMKDVSDAKIMTDDLFDATELNEQIKPASDYVNLPVEVKEAIHSSESQNIVMSAASENISEVSPVEETITVSKDHSDDTFISPQRSEKETVTATSDARDTSSDTKLVVDESSNATKLGINSQIEIQEPLHSSDPNSETVSMSESSTSVSPDSNTESIVPSDAISVTANLQDENNTIQIEERKAILDENKQAGEQDEDNEDKIEEENEVEDDEEEELEDEAGTDDEDDDDDDEGDDDVLYVNQSYGTPSDAILSADAISEKSYFNVPSKPDVTEGDIVIEVTNATDMDVNEHDVSSTVKVSETHTDYKVSEAHVSVISDKSDSKITSEERKDQATVDTIAVDNLVESFQVSEEALKAAVNNVDPYVESNDASMTGSTETVAVSESGDSDHKKRVTEFLAPAKLEEALESLTASKLEEPLESLVPEVVEPPVSDFVTGNFFQDNRELHVTKDVDVNVDSCDANSFEGNCPKKVREESNGKGVEAEELESLDYLQMVLNYLEMLKGCAQVFIDNVPEPAHSFLVELESRAVSPRVIVFTFLVGVFVFVVQIAIVAIQRYSKERSLATKLSNLDRIHFTVSTERDELKEKLDNINHNMTAWKTDYVGAQDALHMLQSELEASQGECGVLLASVANLEDQLEEATEAGLELNRMLSEFLASQNDGGRLQEAVERLQEQLDAQRGRMADMQLISDALAVENDKLRAELRMQVETNEINLGQLRDTTSKLSQAELFVDDLRIEVASRDDQIETLQQSNGQLLNESEMWNETVKDLQNRIDVYESKMQEISRSLEYKSNEVESLKECVSKLRKITQEKGTDGELSADDSDAVWKSLLDMSALKSQLTAVINERDGFSAKLLVENEARKVAEELSQRAVDEAALLRREFDAANQEREEATKRLEILSGYFKEKEMKLQKELGVQEAMRQQNQESVASVHVKMNLYEQEVGHYKSQIASLKLEIESQERSYRNQIANQEKKAHENWLAARSAERRLEESKQEAAALRNKLTLQEKGNARSWNQSDAQSQMQSKYAASGSNGEIGDLPSPPRLAQSDRYDSSQDLPSSSRSSLYKEPLDYNRAAFPFLPIDRPLPPPLPHFMRGLPPGPPLLLPTPPLPPLLPPHLQPFDLDRSGPMLPPPPHLPFDPKRAPPEHWMHSSSPPLSSSSSVQRHGRYDSRHNRSPSHDGDPRSHQYPADVVNFSRGMQPPPPPGVRSVIPSHLRRNSIHPSDQSDGRIDPRTSSPNTRVTDDSSPSVPV